MNILFVSPCGASLILKSLGGDFTAKFRKSIYEYSNLTEEELNRNHREVFEYFEEKLGELEEKILSLNEEDLKNLSAELNGILSYLEKSREDFKQIQHILLPTDTYFGKKISQILGKVLEERFKHIVIYNESIKDLRTSSVEEFHWALKELASKLLRDLDLEAYRESSKVVFNLTGGFKAVNSFLQVMATLYADESVYIFETSKELLSIPKLPIKVDDTIFRKHLDFFRKLELSAKYPSLKLVSAEDIPSDVPESLIIRYDDEVILSPYGEIMWQKVKNEIYKEELINPLTDKLKYSEDFQYQFFRLNPREKLAVNRSLDDLNLYFLSNGNYNPRSLRFHSVENHPQYDFEFYPFEGNDSRRGYLKKIGGIYEIIKIDSHLR